MKLYEEFSECLGSDRKVTPAITLESAENEEVEQWSRVNWLHRCQRESHSSASEMIVFMKEYTAKREEVEEEKVKLMREMQEEKKNFFSQFLEIMRDKWILNKFSSHMYWEYFECWFYLDISVYSVIVNGLKLPDLYFCR